MYIKVILKNIKTEEHHPIEVNNQNVDGNAQKENNKGGNSNFLFNLG